ncbi:MAG: hypothetical protein VKK97_03015 [Synechococcaceae cyanobacterium]|nr:hypothetical protein [Synechococcaceae cyanobacterium]
MLTESWASPPSGAAGVDGVEGRERPGAGAVVGDLTAAAAASPWSSASTCPHGSSRAPTVLHRG